MRITLKNGRQIDVTMEVKERTKKLWNWVVDNKDILIIAVPIVISGVTMVAKHSNLQKSESIKNLYCYDRSLGHYWALKRALSNTEWVEIDQRKRAGEALSDILSEFRVLK